MRVQKITGSYDQRAIALVALKHLMIEQAIRYHGHIILRDLRGFCVYDPVARYEHVRWYRSPLTVLAVADGFEIPRRPVYQVTCGICGRDFDTESAKREHCSAACKQKAYRKRIKAERSA